MNRIALITGCTSGIGLATARLFSGAGYDLILAARRVDRLNALREELAAAGGGRTISIQMDVRIAGEVNDRLHSLPEDWRQIDLLVNNAGLAKGLAPVHEGSLEHWEQMIDTNVKGLLYVSRIVSGWMVSRGSGHIINICSTAGKEVYPNGAVYCASKHAVDALTKGMRMDLYRYGIRVSQLCPGHVEETEFALNRFDGDAERARIYEDFQPLKAADVAETILFVASRPAHVAIQDIVLTGTQQASGMLIDRSGR